MLFSLSICRIVDGTEDSEATESSLPLSFATSRNCPFNAPTSASASTTTGQSVSLKPLFIPEQQFSSYSQQQTIIQTTQIKNKIINKNNTHIYTTSKCKEPEHRGI